MNSGGGAPEIEVSRQLGAWSRTLQGMDSYCVRAFADALEVIALFGMGSCFSWNAYSSRLTFLIHLKAMYRLRLLLLSHSYSLICFEKSMQSQ